MKASQDPLAKPTVEKPALKDVLTGTDIDQEQAVLQASEDFLAIYVDLKVSGPQIVCLCCSSNFVKSILPSKSFQFQSGLLCPWAIELRRVLCLQSGGVQELHGSTLLLRVLGDV